MFEGKSVKKREHDHGRQETCEGSQAVAADGKPVKKLEKGPGRQGACEGNQAKATHMGNGSNASANALTSGEEGKPVKELVLAAKRKGAFNTKLEAYPNAGLASRIWTTLRRQAELEVRYYHSWIQDVF